MEKTLQTVLSLRPDRVAFYSYAHVPWTSRSQRLFDESDLPTAEVKMQLYRLGKFQFALHGYQDVGMDHFALPGDELFKARENGSLHRNFMGYTTQSTNLLIGLGVSSISDTGNAYAQNTKSLREYYDEIAASKLAIRKGYFLDKEDQTFKRYILDISCKGETQFRQDDLPLLEEFCFPMLEELSEDGIVEWNRSGLRLTGRGHHFIRIVCSAFDLFIQRRKQTMQEVQYSKAI